MTKSGETVRRLHRIWRQREDLESRLTRGPKAVAAAQATHAAAVRALQAHRDSIRAKKMEADRKQLQMREREAKLYDLEVKMNMAKADREYQTLKGQIAADTQANRVLTDEILELLEQIDALEARTDEFVAAEQAEAAEAAEVARRIEAARARPPRSSSRAGDACRRRPGAASPPRLHPGKEDGGRSQAASDA